MEIPFIKKLTFPEFNPEKDDILDLLDRLNHSYISDYSGVMRYPYLDFLKKSKEDCMRIFSLDNIENFDAFKEEVELINTELAYVGLHFNSNYVNNLSIHTDLNIDEISAKDVLYFIEKNCIRAKRLLFVTEPDYSLSTGFSKKSKKKYVTVKAFWINANGNKVRSFSKNVGIDGEGIEDSAIKLFESLGYKTFQIEGSLENGYRPDLIIEKNNTKWVVEIKMKDKIQFYKTFARLELWKLYESIYKD